LKKTLKILGTDFSVLLYSILLPALIASMFLYQKVGGGNIWQFLLPVSLVLTILASLNLSVMLSKLNKAAIIMIFVLIIIFMFPSYINFMTYYFKADYLSSFHGISSSELKSYDYLKNNSSKNSMLLLIDQPSYSDCAAVSIAKVVTQRNLFFSGTGVSGVVFPEYLRREKDVAFIKTSQDEKKVIETLKNDDIDYVLIYNNTPIATNSPLLRNKFLKKVFSNQSAKIFEVK